MGQTLEDIPELISSVIAGLVEGTFIEIGLRETID